MPDITNDVLANIPEGISVSFPKVIGGVLIYNVYLEDLALTQYEGKVGHEGTILIRSSAMATITTSYKALTINANSPPPNILDWEDLGVLSSAATDWNPTTLYQVDDVVQIAENLSELEALAEQIATDYYLWKLASLEMRLASYVTLDGDGGHDLEFWHDDPTTVVHRSGWEPDTAYLFHSGSGGSSNTGDVTIITDPATGTATGPEFTVEPTNGLTAVAGDTTLTLGFGGEPYSVIWTEADESPQFTPDILSFDGYTFAAKASVYFDIQNNEYTLEDASTGNIYQYSADDLTYLMNGNVFIEMSSGGQGLAVDASSNVFVGKTRTPTSTTGFMYYSYGTAVPTGIPLAGSGGFGALYIDASDDGRSWWIYRTDGWLKLSKDALTVINVTNIFDYTFIENTIVFNEFNQTINIKYGDTIYNFYADCCEGRQYYCLTKDAVQNCFNLLPSEYFAMIVDGFTYVGGPYATKVLCLTGCSEVPTAWYCFECLGVQGCYELTEAQVQTKLDDGCTPITGKHATQAACLAACDVPPPIDTDCCPDDPTPVTLYGVLSGAADGCECMNGVPFTFTYDAGDQVWWADEEVIPACATIDGGNQLNLWCDAGTWNLDVVGVGNCPDPGFGTMTLVSCAPLVLTHTVTIINCGCGSVGTATLTISSVAP